MPSDDEFFNWTEKALTALSAVANELTQLRVTQEHTETTINILDKRQNHRIESSKAHGQREKRATSKSRKMLDVRELWIPGSKRLSTAQEREAASKWVAKHLRIDWEKIKRTHGPPGRTHVTEKTRLAFETVEDLREWKNLSTT